MPYAIIFIPQEDSEAEMEKLGFKKTTVWMKDAHFDKSKTEREIFNMKKTPYQFVVTGYWGMGVD